MKDWCKSYQWIKYCPCSERESWVKLEFSLLWAYHYVRCYCKTFLCHKNYKIKSYPIWWSKLIKLYAEAGHFSFYVLFKMKTTLEQHTWFIYTQLLSWVINFATFFTYHFHEQTNFVEVISFIIIRVVIGVSVTEVQKFLQ